MIYIAFISIVSFIFSTGLAIAACPNPIAEAMNGKQFTECMQEFQVSISALQTRVAELERGLAPAGAVVAFEIGERSGGACPAGWSFYKEAGGRFILGAGQHSHPGLSTYPSYLDSPEKAVGGEEAHTLTADEMPTHSHSFVGKTVLRGQWTGTPMVALSVGGEGAKKPGEPGPHQPFTPEGSIGDAGGGKEHNNMPPFIALYFCKKDSN